MRERINHFIERFVGFIGGDPLLKEGEDKTVDFQKIEKNKTLFERIKSKTLRKKT